jgi:hypothetical protein
VSQTKDLLRIVFHADDESGLYSIDEADFKISVVELEDYLKRRGVEGRNEVVSNLSYLIYYVMRAAEKFTGGATMQGETKNGLF